MNSFSQFNVAIKNKGFVGDKIKMIKILNREIVVHAYKIDDSKAFKEKGNGKYLCLQISFNNEKHIVFTAAGGLQEVIQQIPETGFPFTTTIIEEDERYIFT